MNNSTLNDENNITDSNIINIKNCTALVSEIPTVNIK
jgi:hypothetical protein